MNFFSSAYSINTRCSRNALLYLVALLGLSCVDDEPKNAEVIQIQSAVGSYELTGAIEVLKDVGKSWTIDRVSRPPFADRFSLTNTRTLDLGAEPAAYWLRFTVDRLPSDARQKEWVLSVKSMAMAWFELYLPLNEPLPASKERWEIHADGYRHNKEVSRPILLPLRFNSRGSTTFYARMECEGYSMAILSIQEKQFSRKRAERQMFWYGVFYGLMAFVILINFLMFVFLKDISYLYCLLYQALIAVYSLGMDGFLDVYFPKPLFESWVYYHVFLIGLIVLFAGAFVRTFLNTQQNAPNTDGFVLIYMVLALVMICLIPFAGLFVLMWYTVVLGLLTPFATILPSIQVWRQGFRPAGFHLAAWSIFGACTFVFAVPIDLGIWQGFVFQIGVAANAILLTLGLVDKMQALRDEREAALATLRESEHKFRFLANSTTALIAMVQNNRLIYANQTFIEYAGMTWEQMRTMDISELLPQAAIEEGMRAWSAAEERGESQFRYQFCGPDGRWFEVNACFVELDGKDAIISTSFDITERKRSDEQMFRAEKMAALGQIIAGIAHEINNPNNFIYFNLPILRKYIEAIRPMLDHHLKEDPKLKILNMPYQVFLDDVYKLLENMEHGSKRITGIVSELKDYVRSDQVQDLQPASIETVVEHVMMLIGKQVRKMVKTFDVEVAGGLPPIKMNLGKIEQVLINLVINAGQAADKKDSWVKLSVALADDQRDVEIKVEDNGCGIPDANVHKIFEPFYTSKSREAGTGLGLSISGRIIEEHNGRIRVQSELGQGTCFIVRLPVYQTERKYEPPQTEHDKNEE